MRAHYLCSLCICLHGSVNIPCFSLMFSLQEHQLCFRLIGALLMGYCMIAETQLLISWLLLLMWWNFSVIQSGHFQYKSVFQGLRSIWQTEGSKGMCVLVEIFYNSFNAPLSLPPTSPFTMQVYTVGCCQLWCGMLPSLAFMFCSTHNPSGLS